MKKISATFLILLMTACASGPRKSDSTAPIEAPSVPKINYDEIQNRLNLDIPPTSTGFKEKVFDACDLGPSLSELNETLKDCHRAYFSLIQFQLQCRPTEESDGLPLYDSDLTPVQDQRLKYSVGKSEGQIYTNASGYGVIRTISSGSQKRSHLRISTGVDFLVVRANEVTNIVTTPSWCVKQR